MNSPRQYPASPQADSHNAEVGSISNWASLATSTLINQQGDPSSLAQSGWNNLWSLHWNHPFGPEAYNAFLEERKRIAHPRALEQFECLRYISVPHPIFPKERLTALRFEDSPIVPESIRGKELFLSNAFLSSTELRTFQNEGGQLNPTNAAKDVPQVWNANPNAPGQCYMNHLASQHFQDIWWDVPKAFGLDANEWRDIFLAVPGNLEEKSVLLNIPSAGSRYAGSSRFLDMGVESAFWSSSLMGTEGAFFLRLNHQEIKKSKITGLSRDNGLSVRTFVPKK